MWTEEQRAIYRRDESRYPSNLTDAALDPYNMLILLHFVSFRLRRYSSGMFAGYSPSITMVRFQRHKTAA
jgi:hypothetical protein